MKLKAGLSLLFVAALLLNATTGEAASKHGRRALHHAAATVAKPYGAGLSDEQSLRALELEISRKLGSTMQEGDYPQEARREGWSGTTWVDVLVGSDGKIKDAAVQRSSGFAVLDEQAVRMVDRINLWWIPQRLRNREVKVAVPVGFYIRDEPEQRWISTDAAATVLAVGVYLPGPGCRNLRESDSDPTASLAQDLSPHLPAAQDSTLAGWRAVHALRE